MHHEVRIEAGVSASPTDPGATVRDLPSPGVGRWTASRKAEIVIAVRDGTLAIIDARKRYNLSFDELKEWNTAYGRLGQAGLQSKHTHVFQRRR
jgi:hypothetical protein